MVQFNLLPDVKIQFIRARRQKYLVMLVSSITIAASVLFIIVLVSMVFGVQRKSISDLSRDIDAASSELQSTEDLTKMLTVQNQLNALPALHESKPVASRIFGYISQATPADVSISRLQTDFAIQSMTISGSASSLASINTFTDTLKFATYHTDSDRATETPAFPSVVLSTYDRDIQGASYTVTLTFDPMIFSDTNEITLTVPNIITTRSQTEQPNALFQESEEQ